MEAGLVKALPFQADLVRRTFGLGCTTVTVGLEEATAMGGG